MTLNKYVFPHQSCATGTLLPLKDIYPRKYRQLTTYKIITQEYSGVALS